MKHIKKVWHKLLIPYRQKSIQYMISLSFTVVALTGMLLLGVALLTSFFSTGEIMMKQNNRRVVEQVNLNLDVYLRNMRRVSDSIYYRVIKRNDLSYNSIDDEMNLLYDANKDLLISIVLLSENGKLISCAPLAKLKKDVVPTQQQWFQNAFDKIENMHFSTPHVQNLFDDPDYRYRWVVSLSRAVELTQNGEVHPGVLLVDMNFWGIEQLFRDVNLGKSGYIYLINNEGDIIYHPRQQLIYSKLLKENNINMAEYDDGDFVETFHGEKQVVTVKSVGYTGWKIVGVMPMKDITANYSHIQLLSLFIIMLLIILTIFINQQVSSKIAEPIKNLQRSVERLEEGNLNADIAVGGSYEIQHLGITIRSMATQMRKLMDDIVLEQEAKRRSELDALQSQINPHFLYNALDSIVWMVENQRTAEANKMVTSLARLFRISLSKGKNIICIADELEHAKNYLTIQMVRYQNKFSVKFDTDPRALNLSTVKLIVQPLLENAIYHGMELMEGEGEIMVKTYLNNNDLYIDVADNGDGISPEVCRLLLMGTEKIRSKGSGIGLKNVHERIQIAFGLQYGLEILSQLGYGTTVRIHLPCIEYNTKQNKED